MGKAERLKLGILLNFSGNWLGGVYYILNIIRSLNYLEIDSDKPEVFLFYNPDLEHHVRDISYPYLIPIAWHFESLPKHYLFSILKRKNYNLGRITQEYDLDAIFPVRDLIFKSDNIRSGRPKLVSWYPDLQHKFYPDFFKKRELLAREYRTRSMLKNTDTLVLSSHDVEKHFRNFYAIRNELQVEVLQFVSIFDDLHLEPKETILKRYQIPDTYFLVSNQFLQHKNHIVVLKAIRELKDMGQDVHVVMTGNMESVRFPDFIESLKKYIDEHNLLSHISLPGIVPRKDQLALMKYCKAVIQPSLFEGWSTVNEDAKTLMTPLIVSDIPVNREQLQNTASYFSPDDFKELSKLLFKFKDLDVNSNYESLDIRAMRFADKFLHILHK